MAAPTTFAEIITAHAEGIAVLTGEPPAASFGVLITQVQDAADALGISFDSSLQDAANELRAAVAYLEDAQEGGADQAALLARAHERLWAGCELAA